jgi:large subunit ribosomal protein L4
MALKKFKPVTPSQRQLVIGGAELDVNFKRAATNIPNIDVLPIQGINVYDILRRGTLVLSKAAVEALEERFK